MGGETEGGMQWRGRGRWGLLTCTCDVCSTSSKDHWLD